MKQSASTSKTVWRLSLGRQLLLFGLGILALPWLGYQYLQDMQAFLIEGQEQAQRLAARAIATSLANRQHLFPPVAGGLDAEPALYVHSLAGPIQVDGYAQDWADLSTTATRFKPAAEGGEADLDADLEERNLEAANLEEGDLEFELTLGQRGSTLYGLVVVRDARVVYRHPAYPRVDSGDHLRLTLTDSGGRVTRYLLTTEGVGALSVYAVDEQWRQPQGTIPVHRLRGAWQEFRGGYRVEFQLPLEGLGQAPRLDLAVADVRDPVQRRVAAVWGTPDRSRLDARSAESGEARPGVGVLVRSPELEAIVRNLQQNDRHIWILDRQGRVRALSRGADARPEVQAHFTRVIEKALWGYGASERYRVGETEYLLSAQAIPGGEGKEGQVLGAVLVEMATDRLLSLQRLTLLKSATATAGVFVLILLGLMIFAFRLTRRIARLRLVTRQSIDGRGRLLNAAMPVPAELGDELGDLAEDIAALLGKVTQYTRFLEKMPRTLRHELSNPLNTISTSLEHLREQLPTRTAHPYLDSAVRGVDRLDGIVQSLTEAASLEEALGQESLQPVDLPNLVRAYVAHCQGVHGAQRFVFEDRSGGCHIAGDDLRLEQLLDKLVDNALSFCPPDGCIDVRLERRGKRLWLQVYNPGPPIPPDVAASLFDSLISSRSNCASGTQPHLGIGLYVVKVIADHHGAEVGARNVAEGVCFSVDFPLPTED